MFEANIKTKIRTFATFSDFMKTLTLFKKCFGGQNNLAGERLEAGIGSRKRNPPALKGVLH